MIQWSPSLLGAGAQAGDVGAAGGLGEQLAPDLLAGGDLRQIAPLVLPRCHRPSPSARTCPRRSGTGWSACRRRPLPAARSPARSGSRRGRHIPSASAGRPSRPRPSSSARPCRPRRCRASCSRMRPSEDLDSSASNSLGALASIHWRASARNAASCGVSSKFMAVPSSCHSGAGAKRTNPESRSKLLDSGFALRAPRNDESSPVPWSVSC